MDDIAREDARGARVGDGRARRASSGGREHDASRCPEGWEKAKRRRKSASTPGRGGKRMVMDDKAVREGRSW